MATFARLAESSYWLSRTAEVVSAVSHSLCIQFALVGAGLMILVGEAKTRRDDRKEDSFLPFFLVSFNESSLRIDTASTEQALGAMMLAWISRLGWFKPEQSSDGGDAVSFNWHPLLMTLAFPVLMTEGMMAYKLEHDHGVSHGTSKRVHGSLQGASLLFAAIGVALVFANHQQKGIPHLYSAHSWLGIATLTLLVVQAGIAALLFGTSSFFSEHARHIALPFHRCVRFAPTLP